MRHTVGTIVCIVSLIGFFASFIAYIVAFARCLKHPNAEENWIDLIYPRISFVGLVSVILFFVGQLLRI